MDGVLNNLNPKGEIIVSVEAPPISENDITVVAGENGMVNTNGVVFINLPQSDSFADYVPVFICYILYFFILIGYAVSNSRRIKKEKSEKAKTISLKKGGSEKISAANKLDTFCDMQNNAGSCVCRDDLTGLGEIWCKLTGDPRMPKKKYFVYLLIIIMLITIIYTIFLLVTQTSGNDGALTDPRFWEETFMISFAFAIGMLVPGMYENKEPNYTLVAIVFVANVVFNIVCQLIGFYDALYSDLASLECNVVNGEVDLQQCVSNPLNFVAPSIFSTYFLYIFILALISILILPALPNIFTLNSSHNAIHRGEAFNFIDTMYLGLTNGLNFLLAVQYINLRRSFLLVAPVESFILIMKFVIFHIGLRFSGIF